MELGSYLTPCPPEGETLLAIFQPTQKLCSYLMIVRKSLLEQRAMVVIFFRRSESCRDGKKSKELRTGNLRINSF
jgi:hypothetical protein